MFSGHLLADWSGRAAFALRLVHELLLEVLKASVKLFADETRAGQSWFCVGPDRAPAPLYRQAQIYGRQGVELDRSTLRIGPNTPAAFARVRWPRLLRPSI
jgi:transposase